MTPNQITNEHHCSIYTPRNIPQSAVGAKGKYWEVGQKLRIKFHGGTSDEQEYVRHHASVWLEYADLDFEWVTTQGTTDIRIGFLSSIGSHSTVGRDARYVSQNETTMNLGWKDPQVVKHEFGHMLGLYHEHQNPDQPIDWDVPVVVADLSGPPNNWNLEDIRWNVFKTHEPDAVDTTPLDRLSIMGYQVPSRWTKNGFGIPFNLDLSEVDKQFIARIYSLPPVADPKKDLLRDVFGSVKELSKLSELAILRTGYEIGLDLTAKDLKAKNVRAVADALGL